MTTYYRLCVFALLLDPALAQTATGTLAGTVSDTTGTAVPNAKMTVRERATGAVTRTTTSEAGRFVMPNLAPGTYTIQVEPAGFKPLVITNGPGGYADTPSTDGRYQVIVATTGFRKNAQDARTPTPVAQAARARDGTQVLS